MLKIQNKFSTSSITNKDLNESVFAKRIESGKCTCFYGEENVVTGKSYSLYFAQKAETETTNTDGLAFGIIANTASRGEATRIFRAVLSATTSLNGVNQDVVVDTVNQTITFVTDGVQSVHSIDTMAINQIRSVGYPITDSIGYNPVFVQNKGYLAVGGTPVFDKYELRVYKSTQVKAIQSTIKHDNFITEMELIDYLMSKGVDSMSVARMIRQPVDAVNDKVKF